jgi:hypothetical protein
MLYQKVAIRILLYSLALAALTGILAIVIPNSSNVLWRLLGTAIYTAITSGLLVLAIYRIQFPITRAFGTSLGITSILTYFCALGAIWVPLIPAIGNNLLGRNLEISGLLIAGIGLLISVGFLGNLHKKLRFAGFVLSGIWAICLFVWLLSVWVLTSNQFQLTAEHIAFPLQTLFPLVVLCSIRRHILYMIIAIGCSVGCCVLSQYALFSTQGHLENTTEVLFHFIVVTGGFAAILAASNIVQFRKKKNAIPAAEWSTIGITCITVTILCISIALDYYKIKIPEYVVRLSVGSSILNLTAFLGLIAMRALRSSAFTNYNGKLLEATCPRCRHSLNIPTGKSHCPACGLQMKLKIESPLCRSCGYDISKTPNCSSCPECGDSIMLSGAVQ